MTYNFINFTVMLIVSIFQSMETHDRGFTKVLCSVVSQVLQGTRSSKVLSPQESWVLQGPGSSRALSHLGSCVLQSPGSSRVLPLQGSCLFQGPGSLFSGMPQIQATIQTFFKDDKHMFVLILVAVLVATLIDR